MTSQIQERPNIVFILTDDQGYWALGCAGNDEIHTPHLDRLAATGIRFENFFCASPVCSPARASILTGRIPSQHGVHDWIRRGNLASNSADRGDECAIEYLAGMTGYTDRLAEHDYVCGISGKWHLGDSLHPQKGFSYWHVFPSGGGDYHNVHFVRDGRLEQEPGYLTDAITEGGLRFLDAQAASDAPFYLSVHYTAPHSPWERGQHPEELVSLYADCDFRTCPDLPTRHPWQINSAPRGRGAKRHELLSGYYAAITGVDRGVGQIIARLEAMRTLENTLVIFTSDNGMNMGHHGLWGKGNATFPQNMYDTSVKVPMLMARPGHLPAGVVCDDLLSHYDLRPTLLDYVGLAEPEAGKLPGHSFAALLRGETDAAMPTTPGTAREATRTSDRQRGNCHEEIVVLDEYGPTRMIRTREWKYVHRYPYGPHELFDLAHDPDEARNLIAEPAQQGRVAEMAARLEAWFVHYTDPALDGTKEPVTGKGQLDLAGVAGQGRPAFADDWWYIDEDGNQVT